MALAGFTVVATIGSLIFSRWVFQRALLSYRSASKLSQAKWGQVSFPVSRSAIASAPDERRET